MISRLGLKETTDYLILQRAYIALARNYLLHKTSKLNDEKDIGLHRDQALAIVKN